MNLTTQYLGLQLKNPFVLGACPITHDLDTVLRVVESGASALVMHSLFEEQIAPARGGRPDEAALTEYLEQLQQIKAKAGVPVIASLNGATDEGWLRYAKNLEQAGADALELNVYHLTLDPEENAVMIERQLIEMVRKVTQSVKIPVAIKLSPFYAGLPNLVRRLVHEGARGVVMFNRFYEPDIDIDKAALEPRLHLSDSRELTLRLRWLAAIAPKTAASLACTGGVHNGAGALKAILAGAHVVQVVSAVLSRGPTAIATMRRELEELLVSHAYESVDQARGRMDLAHCQDTTFYHRGNYLKVLQAR